MEGEMSFDTSFIVQIVFVKRKRTCESLDSNLLPINLCFF